MKKSFEEKLAAEQAKIDADKNLTKEQKTKAKDITVTKNVGAN